MSTFTGFGLGAIQSGLFLLEAHKTGRFDRLVVAEIDPSRVAALRAGGGTFYVNAADADQRRTEKVTGVEVFNPLIPEDREPLVAALAESCEIATALPSIRFFNRGSPSVAELLREALQRKLADAALPTAVVYTAENHNHAAEALEDLVFAGLDKPAERMQMLNTVIGKMSSVVTDSKVIRELALTPITPEAGEAFLVEAFNRILVSRVMLPGFRRNITAFEEKEELLPFEEAKLYGHNAIHALLGFLAAERRIGLMSDLADHPDLVELGRRAFLEESGAALIRKHAGIDSLFTPEGFEHYAEDLLERMLNPWLRDPIDRVIRDPERKLGWNDRLVGTLRLALQYGIQPTVLIQGIRTAIKTLPESNALAQLQASWRQEQADPDELMRVLACL